MEMTMTITVPVEVSRTALALWVSGMLNMPVLQPTGCEDEYQEDMDLLDSMDDEVFVSWEDAGLRPAEVYERAVKLWGPEFQAMMLAEECGELVAAMSQYLRRRVAAEKVIEEVADVHIMLAQVPHLLGGDPAAHQKAISKVVTDKKWRLENLVYGEVKA
jgi:NTP pyrophosphatase (non-canonical NTP hydrolase)